MCGTWYKTTVMLPNGLDIEPISTHRYQYTELKTVWMYGSSQKNCNTIEVTRRKEKGTDPFCAQHPAGRPGKRGAVPFPLRKMLKMLQFFSNGP